MTKLGHEVVGVDVIPEQVASLAQGEAPFHEPGLPELLKAGLATGRLEFTTDASRASDASSTSSVSGLLRSGARTLPTCATCTRPSRPSCRS